MVAYVGRDVAMTWNGASIPGIQEKGVKYNDEPIDISADEDAGKRVLLANASGMDSLDIAISGVTKSDVLRAAWMSGARSAVVVMTWPNGASINGTFQLSKLEDGIKFKDANTFSVSLLSSGAWAYTPGV